MSDVSTMFRMDSATRSKTEQSVNSFNKANDAALREGRTQKTTLDKDDFLTILMTQLKHQDPTKPMEDREFIAQMAQFSSLEQMKNLAKGVNDMSGMLASGQAMNALGRKVEISDMGRTVTGKVDGVTTGTFPQVLVGGTYYDFANVKNINLEE